MMRCAPKSGRWALVLSVATVSACDGFDAAPFITNPVVTDSVPSLPTLVSAGADRQVRMGDHVCLDGTGTYDPLGRTFTLTWTQVASNANDKVYLSNVASVAPCFVAPLSPQTLVFGLSADNGVFVTQDQVNFYVVQNPNAAAPAVRAGPDRFLQNTEAMQPVESDIASADANVTPTWESVALFQSMLSPQATPEAVGIFRLRATDNASGLQSTPDYLLLWPADANQPSPRAAPSSALSAPTFANAGGTISLDASGSRDAYGDTLHWRWQQTCGDNTLGMPGNVMTVNFNAPSRLQVVCLRVAVRDSWLESAPTDVLISVVAPSGAVAPVVAPPSTQPVHPGNAVYLNADPNGQNASTVTYAWQQTSGPAVSFAGGANVLAFTAPPQGTLAFTVAAQAGTITTGDGVSIVSVEDPNTNQPPTVALCVNTNTPAAGSSVTVYGAAFDPEQDAITNAAWSATPSGLAAVSVGTNAAGWPTVCGPMPTFNGLRPLLSEGSLTAPASGVSVTITFRACDGLGACGTGQTTLTSQ